MRLQFCIESLVKRNYALDRPQFSGETKQPTEMCLRLVMMGSLLNQKIKRLEKMHIGASKRTEGRTINVANEEIEFNGKHQNHNGSNQM